MPNSLRSDLHGKGIASKAADIVINLPIEHGIKHFNSGCLARNIGSQKVLVKNGFSIDRSLILQEGKYQNEEMLLFTQTRTQQEA